MRVLHTLNELKASGAEVMLARAAPLWRANGIVTDVLSSGTVVGEFAETLAASGLQVHHIPFERNVNYFRALRRFIAEGQYDVVHVHPERAFFWVAMAIRAGGIRHIVRSVHNVFAFTGALRIERFVQRAVLRRLGVVFVSVSTSVQTNERSRFRNPTLHIHNWVDTSLFRPPSEVERAAARRRFGLVDNALAIVTVGNCGTAKNHRAVVEALPALDDLRPLYLHAGQEEDDRPECALAKSVGVIERCRFLGRVEAVDELLHAADAYVMPSHYEGLPIAALEAAAAGVSCVFARVPGLSDLEPIVGDNAVWIRPDAASVARGVRAVAETAWSEQRAWQLHKSVATEFGVERGAADFVRLYRSLQ